MADVTLLCRENPGVHEVNLMKIVKFLGGSVHLVELTEAVTGHPDRLERVLPRGSGLIVSAETLAGLAGESGRGAAWQAMLAGRAANILVYGFAPTESHGQLLKELTAGVLAGVQSSPTHGCKINVARDFRAVCRQLSGVSFDAVGAQTQRTFVQGIGQGIRTALIALDQNPFLVRSNVHGSQWLLLAGDQVADLDVLVPEDKSILEFFASLVPVLMFLRNASSKGFWHNDRPTACFIIDDPLLKQRYGFLDYQKLLELMERKHFSTSIAFIPWNRRRSQRHVAELFARHPQAYSLCIHGCDHTRGEFGGTDRAELREKAQQALEWMKRHRESSGVAFDDVMVFPQGIFSTTAMQALRSSGYLAASNSTAYPVDARQSLTLRDLLQVAVTRFSNFPLFTRRYPRKLAELAFDLFLGKPALVVEHHGFFRDGYDALAETVEKLQGMDDRLKWNNLESICSRACLEKVADNGDIHVLFYTNRFVFRNETDQARNYVFMRRTFADEGKPAVSLNGRPAEAVHEDDCLKLESSLAPGEQVEITTAFGGSEPRTLPARRDRWYEARVFIRRSLSEFRDNYLDLNPFVSRAVRK